MLCHVSDPWIIRAPHVNHWGVFFYLVRLSYNFNKRFILFPFWEIKNAWNALDIATKVKRSPVFHSDVFISTVLSFCLFPSNSPLQFRREHISPLFYPPLAYCSSSHSVLVLSSGIFSPFVIYSWMTLTSSSGVRVQWSGLSHLWVGEFYHRSAGCKPCVQQLSWESFPTSRTFHWSTFLYAQ